jgi:hypothetical protein
MALYSLDGEKQTNVPKSRLSTYRQAERELTPSQMQEIKQAINSYINGKRVFVSSHIPGSDWTGTVYWPIYEKAAHYNYDIARWIFGLIVWKTVIERKEDWFFKKPLEPGEGELMGMTYFQKGEV